jgi:alkyl hydroperoxide reductase subunit F
MNTYDLIIIGGGPAGAAAAVYAARKQLKTAIIATEFGGQSVVSETIYNWIGTPEISGVNLAKNLKSHVEYYKGEFLDIFEGQMVTLVEKNEQIFSVTTNKQVFQTKSVLVTTGSSRRKLQIPGQINSKIVELYIVLRVMAPLLWTKCSSYWWRKCWV